jgi:hypothetical protein
VAHPVRGVTRLRGYLCRRGHGLGGPLLLSLLFVVVLLLSGSSLRWRPQRPRMFAGVACDPVPHWEGARCPRACTQGLTIIGEGFARLLPRPWGGSDDAGAVRGGHAGHVLGQPLLQHLGLRRGSLLRTACW